MDRKDILLKKEEILTWIKQGKTKHEMSEELFCKPETLNKYLKIMNINYKGKQGFKKNNFSKYKTIDDYLKNCKTKKSDDYKKKLILFGIKKEECEICHNNMWNNKKIPLELHHIDGNHFNNELQNIQILCPNCHAQQDNNSGKNNKRYKEKLAIKKQKMESKKDIIDKIGRINNSKIPFYKWQERKEKILKSGVDFSKRGWKTKVMKITGLTKRQLYNTIKNFPDVFLKKPE